MLRRSSSLKCFEHILQPLQEYVRVLRLEDQRGAQPYGALATAAGVDAVLAQARQHSFPPRARVAVKRAEGAAAAHTVDILRESVLQLL